jgi:hypothetical protein
VCTPSARSLSLQNRLTIVAGFREKGGDKDALDPANPKRGPALSKPNLEKQDPRFPAPEEADVGNICLQQFPPPVREMVTVSLSRFPLAC